MCCLLLSTHHTSLIFIHMSSFSLIASVSFCSHYLLGSVITFRGMLHTFWRWIKCFPRPSVTLNPPAFIRSASRLLLVTCGHVCMTEEMQNLAQTITICLVCTIYMKYIFIHDMRAHEIASPSPSSPVSLMPQSLCSVQEVFQTKTLASLMPLISYTIACVAFYLPYFTHKCTWITPR